MFSTPYLRSDETTENETLTPSEGGLALRSIPAFGTTATVAVTDPSTADQAEDLLACEIVAMDNAASRFRPDSEVSTLRNARGAATRVSPLMFEAVVVALAVAEWTDGAVDPTVGGCLEALGYDRDFSQVQTTTANEQLLCGAPGWHSIVLDHNRRTVSIPRGTLLDLGSSAKALSADRAARSIARVTGSGTLVSIGGDVSVAGRAPDAGWAIGIAHSSTAGPNELEQVVSVESGGLATSSTTVRAWSRNGQTVHHIVDPRSGRNVDPCWSVVSVAGSSCVEANAASTAAFVWGASAPQRLTLAGLPARLVSITGDVTTVCGWPDDSTGPSNLAEAAS